LELLGERFADVVSFLVSDLEDLIGIERIQSFLEFLLLLIFVPKPFVDLALFQSGFLCEFFHLRLRPIRVLGILLLQVLHLIFILSSPLLILVHLIHHFFFLELSFNLLLLSLGFQRSFKDIVHLLFK